MIKVYGIKNCDTVKKALKHLDQRGVDYEFCDFKKTPPSKEVIQSWKKHFGDWPVNKRGRTYVQNKETFENASDADKMKILQEQTSMIKRPVIEATKSKVSFGYDKELIESL